MAREQVAQYPGAVAITVWMFEGVKAIFILWLHTGWMIDNELCALDTIDQLHEHWHANDIIDLCSSSSDEEEISSVEDSVAESSLHAQALDADGFLPLYREDLS